MSQKTICFKTDEEFFKKVKVHTANTGETLQHYVGRLIQADLNNEKPESYASFKVREELKSIHSHLVNVHGMLEDILNDEQNSPSN